MIIAAAYIRVSTDDQLEYSPDSQLKCIREYVKAHDMILPEEFIFREAEGVSGRSAKKRPEFQRMIGTARDANNLINVILVWKFSRFARNQEESIVYKSLLRRERGIRVISVSEPIAEDTEFGGLIERIIEWMDGYYSIRLAGEVRRGMTERFQRGKPVSVAPYGYKTENQKWVVNPETAPIVHMLFEQFAAGEGYVCLARKLNSMGIKTRRGATWENRTVEYILNNPAYIGKIRWNPSGVTRRAYDDPNVKIIDGEHEPIISPELWDRVQERVKMLKNMYDRHDRATGLTRLLQGIVRCSTCGRTLSPSGVGYQCLGYAHGKCKVSHYISTGLLEDMVMQSIADDMTSGTDLSIVPRKSAKTVDDRDLIAQQIAKERTKLLRIREAYEAGVDTLDEYRIAKRQILDRIQELEAKSTPQESTPTVTDAYRAECLEKLSQAKDTSLPLEKRNAILRTFIDHITFDRASCSVKIFYYL